MESTLVPTLDGEAKGDVSGREGGCSALSHMWAASMALSMLVWTVVLRVSYSREKARSEWIPNRFTLAYTVSVVHLKALGVLPCHL